jgi:hypothetical protein
MGFIRFFKNLIFFAMIICFGCRVASFGNRHLNDYAHANSLTSSMHHLPQMVKTRRPLIKSRVLHIVDYANPLTSIFIQMNLANQSPLFAEKNTDSLSHSWPILSYVVPTPPPSRA